MSISGGFTDPTQRPMERSEDHENKEILMDDFDQELGVVGHLMLATNSAIQIVLQKWRNEVAQEEPSPIKIVKQIFISISFGLNTLFGLVEIATRVALFIIPYLISLAIDLNGKNDIANEIHGTITASILLSGAYTMQSALSSVVNLQHPDQQLTFIGGAHVKDDE